jgi:hypothetical protein
MKRKINFLLKVSPYIRDLSTGDKKNIKLDVKL